MSDCTVLGDLLVCLHAVCVSSQYQSMQHVKLLCPDAASTLRLHPPVLEVSFWGDLLSQHADTAPGDAPPGV